MRPKIGLLTHNWQDYETKNLIACIEEVGELVRIDPFKTILPSKDSEMPDVLISWAQVKNPEILQPYKRCLEYFECPILNNATSLELCQDKYRTYRVLCKHKIPSPKSYLTYSKEKAAGLIDELGLPVIIKDLWKGSGIGSLKFDTKDEAEKYIEGLARRKKPIFIQVYLEKGNKDIRAQVVGDGVVASVYRIAKKGEWRTNISRGGKPVKVELSDELKELSIKAAQAVKADVAGVDIVETAYGNFVLEVNITPSYGPKIEKVTGVNVSKEIINYALSLIKEPEPKFEPKRILLPEMGVAE